MARKAAHSRKSMTTKKRAVLITVISLLGVLAIVLIAASAYVWYALDRISDDPVDSGGTLYWEPISDLSIEDPSSGESVVDPEEIPDHVNTVEDIPVVYDNEYVTNILIMGVESKSKTNPYVGRSDSCIIMSINRQTEAITLVSLLRDTYVAIPGHGYNKLNAAYAYGGPDLLKATIELNFRIHVDYHVAINFEAFIQIINVMDGLEVTMSAAEAKATGVGTTDGTYNLTGEQALLYSRIRVGVGNDSARTGRQRHVIKLLFEKAKHMSIAQLSGALDKVLDYVRTNLSEDQLMGYIFDSGTYLGYQIKERAVPDKGQYDDPYIDGAGRVKVLRNPQDIVLSMLHALYDIG